MVSTAEVPARRRAARRRSVFKGLAVWIGVRQIGQGTRTSAKVVKAQVEHLDHPGTTDDAVRQVDPSVAKLWRDGFGRV